jgi:hypothetical protein
MAFVHDDRKLAKRDTPETRQALRAINIYAPCYKRSDNGYGLANLKE